MFLEKLWKAQNFHCQGAENLKFPRNKSLALDLRRVLDNCGFSWISKNVWPKLGLPPTSHIFFFDFKDIWTLWHTFCCFCIRRSDTSGKSVKSGVYQIRDILQICVIYLWGWNLSLLVLVFNSIVLVICFKQIICR